MPDLEFLLIGGLAALVGAVVQGSVGLGVGLVATPVVTMLFPSLMPGSILVMALVLPVATLAQEFRHAELRGIGWAFAGRLAGTPLGAWLVAVVPDRALGIMIGLIVLAALAATSWSREVPRNRRTLSTAGLISGTTGTASGIGGPPIALLYQRESGPAVRATLAVFFVVGALLSLATLAAAGQLPARQVVAGLELLPFVLAGFLLSGPLRRYLDAGRLRLALLIVVGTSAVVLIVRNLI
ncbi:sulfite exporter TauE/SafE family protein [Actinomadura livida]|uniref:Probable membrane transporter protein n=1 Tax=Actinomadura livida TaxID=79909 RepID=A0A7W7MXS7_9ACTN|nr:MULTISPECIES: sulfite exporter TauE/SafE family protein [Actinomadura]MBB4774187.1 putative membrane protein YfcA [Actinomadura catellatispora]GGT84279.1 permease [Actinomadura livida]